MPQIIEVPGHGLIEFPDGMSDADIVSAIKSNFRPPEKPPSPEKTALLEEKAKLDSGETAEKLRLNPYEQFGGDVWRGIKNLQQTGAGLAGLGADLIGADEIAKERLERYKEIGEEAQLIPGQVGDRTHVKDLGTGLQYVAEKVAENLPMAIPSMVTGGLGSFVAKKLGEKAAVQFIEGQVAKGVAREVAREQAAKIIARQVAAAGAAGAFPAAAGLEQGSIYGDIFEKTGQMAPGTAAVLGAGAGALDIIPTALMLRRVMGPNVTRGVVDGLIKRVGKAAAEQVLTESPTEGFQTLIERAAVEKIDPNQRALSKEGINEIIESMLAGGLAGGAMGAAGGVAEHVLKGAKTPGLEPPDPALKAEADRLRAADLASQKLFALPHANDFVGRALNVNGVPTGVITGWNDRGFLVHFKGQEQPSVVPYDTLQMKPGENFRFENLNPPIIPPKPKSSPTWKPAGSAAAAPGAAGPAPGAPGPATATPGAETVTPVTPIVPPVAPTVEAQGREALAVRILTKAGVAPDIAERFGRLVTGAVSPESGLETFRDEVLGRFRRSGLVSEGEMYRYSEDPAYYRGNNFSEAEVTEHVKNAKIANEQLLGNARAKNTQRIADLEKGGPDAIALFSKQSSSVGERPAGDGSGKTAETGGGNRPVSPAPSTPRETTPPSGTAPAKLTAEDKADIQKELDAELGETETEPTPTPIGIRKNVLPLGFEVDRSKPLEAQRIQILRLIAKQQADYDAAEEAGESPFWNAERSEQLHASLADVEKQLLAKAKPTPNPEPGPKPGSLLDQISELSSQIRSRTISKSQPVLWKDQPDQNLLAELSANAAKAYGEIVTERADKGRLTTAQTAYLNTWNKDKFAQAVLDYIKRNDLLRDRPAAQPPVVKPTTKAPAPKPVGIRKRSQPAPKPAPAPSPEPSTSIKQGDWIEWTDDYGKVRQGKVDAVWKTGRFVPGVGAETPRIEYSTPVGTARQEQNPRVIPEPAPAPAPTPAAYGSENKIFTQDAYKAALEKLKKKLGQTNTIDPELLMLGTQIAGYHVEAGARKFADFTKAMVNDLGEAIRPYLRSLYSAIRDYPGMEDKGLESSDDVAKQLAAVAKPNEQEQSKPEATNEPEQGSSAGQPVANPPPVDVREPAGPGAESEPAGETGSVSGPEVPAGTGSSPQTQKERPVGIRGTRRRGGASPGTSGEPEPVRQPAEPNPPSGTEANPAEPARVEKPKGPEDQNHVLPRDHDWIPSGDKSKVRANFAAIKLLKQLEAEDRNPSPAEKETLAKYVGWGGLKAVFDEAKAAYRNRKDYLWGDQKTEYERWEKNWGKLYDEVKATLTEDEWNRAARSVLNAHYTSRTIISRIWDAVERLGFKGGVALEPAGGVGHFLGLQPETSRGKTRWAAVELDDISGRILRKLYPEAKVQVTGFEKARIPNNSIDLAISNVPFAKDGPIDDRYPRLSLHNYFFARALDVVKPGGLVAFITSNSTMDNDASRAAREYMAERADLVGAIRLPNTAFKENAGTEVTTDILFFRKRDGTPFQGQPFTRTVDAETYKGEPVEINEYFKAHPEMMLGRMSLEGTMYGGNEQALLPTPGANLDDQIQEAIGKLPENVFGAQQIPGEAAPEAGEAATGKIGALSMRDGKPVIAQADGSFDTPDWASQSAKVTQAKQYLGVRDATIALINRMLASEATDEQIAADRTELNRLYDAYVKKFGPINERRSSFLEDDGDFPLVLALEDGNTKLIEGKTAKGKAFTRRVTDWAKSKIFSERTIFPREAPTHVDTPEDGYQVSMNFRGRVDVDYIAALTGQDVEAVKNQLQAASLAFENPSTGQWEPAWRYLSGDVKGKLDEARKSAEDEPRYQANVGALEKVQPEPIAFENISFKLGSTFIDPSIVQKFLRETMGLPDATVQRVQATGNWIVSAGWTGAQEALNTTTYGMHGFTGANLVGLALNLKNPTVTKPETRISESGNSYEVEVKDSVKSAEATEKQSQVKRAFVDWVKQDPESAKAIEKHYNETANRSRIPTFDPPTWTHYPGASQDVTLRPHQMRVVTRMLQDSTMLAHAVGTGKTYAMITTAMEMRRLGLAKKPMIVVQNATLEQFARSFKRLYPASRILVPSAKQRDSKNRNRTMSRVATGDWDAVIIPQSFVNMLPDDPERERAFINDQLKALKEAKIEAAAAEGKKSPKVADIQRAIDKLEKKLSDLADRKKDNVLNFEQLGVDALFVDEAHAYKKLQFSTKMENIKGLDLGASQRGLSMFLKVRAVQEKNQGRNVVFATGTPVSNTIAEIWTMIRYLRPDILKRFDMEDFDSFAANYGDTVSRWEMTAGGTWKPVTRFARYTNGPELISAWRSVADVVTPEEVNLPGLPAVKGGKARAIVIPKTPRIAAYVDQLREELEAFDKMSGKQKRDNSHIPLVVFGRAKKATLDMRLIDSSLPDEEGSKLNKVADEVARIYKESTDAKGAQMVFADLFQNPDGTFNLYLELKRKLRERGIPENEILIVTDEIKEAKREAAFQKLNDGEIRVAIGSTERMGIGVNAQAHLVALHHMDAPARPMDVEQRNGRIVRQGNENPMVEILSYGVEGTLDAALFQRLATKQQFINQIMRGDLKGRNFEDAANEVSLSFEEQMAAFSGDPLALEKVTLENELRTLENLRSAHYQQVREGRETLDRLINNGIPYDENRLARATEDAQQFGAEFADMDKVQMKYGERVFTGKKDIATLLDEKFKTALEDARKVVRGRIEDEKMMGGFTEQPLPGFKLQSLSIELHASAKGEAFEEDGKRKANITESVIEWRNANGFWRRVTTGNGFFSSLDAFLRDIQSWPGKVEGELASKKRQVLQLQSFVKLPFDREEELAKVKKRYDEVLSKISASSTAAKISNAKQEVAPLGFEISRYKPLEAQRNQIRRLIEAIEARYDQRQGDYEAREMRRKMGFAPDDSQDVPPFYHATIVQALKDRLAEIEQEMLGKVTGKTEDTAQFSLNSEDERQTEITSGADREGDQPKDSGEGLSPRAQERRAKVRPVLQANNGGSAFLALQQMVRDAVFEGTGVTGEIAKQLITLGDKGVKLQFGGRYNAGSEMLPKWAGGRYNPDTDTVHVYDDARIGHRVFVHEYVHALTYQALRDSKNKPLIEKLEELFRRSVIKAEREGLGFYGLQWRGGWPKATPNLDEFVAEAFGNKRFQEFLNRTRGIGTQKSLWQTFVDFIAKLLGIKQSSALADVLRITGDLIAQREAPPDPMDSGESLFSLQPISSEAEYRKMTASEGLMAAPDALHQAKLFQAMTDAAVGHVINDFTSLPADVQAQLPMIQGRIDVIDAAQDDIDRISGGAWSAPTGTLRQIATAVTSEPDLAAQIVGLAQNEMMNLIAEAQDQANAAVAARAEAVKARKIELKKVPAQRLEDLGNALLNTRRGQLLAVREAAILAGAQVAEAQANADLAAIQNTQVAMGNVVAAMLRVIPDTLITNPTTPEDILKVWRQKRRRVQANAADVVIDAVEIAAAGMPDLAARLNAIKHPEKSPEVLALEKKADDMAEARRFLARTISNSDFQDKYKEAIEITGSRGLIAKENAEHELSWDNPLDPEQSVTLRRGFSSEEYRHNVKALETAKQWFEDYLDPTKNPNPDPLKVPGIEAQLWAIDNVHLSQQFDPAVGKPLVGGFNLPDYFMRATGGAMDVPDYIVQMSGGAPADATMAALNNYSEAQRATQKADNRESVRASIATLKASKAHNMDVAQWSVEIGDEIAGSYQNLGTPKVRVGDKVHGHEVTQLDLDAVKLHKVYVDSLRQAALDALKTPSGRAAEVKIRDKVGMMTFEREAMPTSELTVPQRLAPNAIAFQREWLAIANDGALSDDQKLDEWEQLLDTKFSRQGLVGHVRSFDDPQYAASAESPFRADYVDLLRDFNTTGQSPFSTVSELSDILFARQQNLPPVAQLSRADIRAQIIKEINGAVKRFADDEKANDRLVDPDQPQVSVISAENFMNRPRGRRMLPKPFYTYTAGTKGEQDQVRFHILQVFAQRLQNALQSQLQTVKTQISEWKQAIKEGGLTEEQIRDSQKAGENFLNLAEAEQVSSSLQRFITAFDTYVKRNMGQEFKLYQPFNLLRGTAANAILQRAPTLLMNYMGAAFQRALLDATVLKSGKNFLLRFSPLGVTYASAKSIAQHGLQTVNAALGMILNQPEVSPKLRSLAAYIRRNQSYFGRFAGMVTDYMERQRARVEALKDARILDDDPWRYNMTALIGMATQGGRLQGEKPKLKRKLAELVRTAILMANETGIGLQLPRAMGVSAVESFNNALADRATNDLLADLMAFSKRAFDTRQASGYDPVKSILSAQEIFGQKRAKAADAALLRQMFERARLNLDRVLIEHWQYIQSGGQPRTLKDTLGAEKYTALVREMAAWLNKGGFSNRPFYNSAIGRAMGLFLGYGINQNAQLSRMNASFSRDPRNALWKNLDHFQTAITLFLLLSVFGALYQPPVGWLKKWLYREEHPVRPIWKARSWSEAFLTDIQNMASQMPLLGRVFVNLFGAATPGTRLSMFGFQFFPVSSAESLIRAFSKAWQTGDVDRAAIELIRQFVPNSRVWFNRLPGRQGTTTETNVRNILTANAPVGVEIKPNSFSTGAVQYSPARGYVDDVVNALSKDGGPDMETVRQAREAGIAKLVAAGKSQKEATRAFDRSIMARNPFTAIYGRNLTDSEMTELRNSLSPDDLGQLDRLVSGRQAYAREFGLNEPDYTRDEPGSSGGTGGALPTSPGRSSGTSASLPFGLRRSSGAPVGIRSRGAAPNVIPARTTGPQLSGFGAVSTAIPTGLPRMPSIPGVRSGLRARGIRGLRGRRSGLRSRRFGLRVRNSRRIRLRRR